MVLYALGLLRWLLLRLRQPRVGNTPFLVPAGCDVQVKDDGILAVGPGLQLRRDFSASIFGTLQIGRSVFFNRGCYVAVRSKVVIGDRCRFGEGVSIHDADHAYGPALGEPGGRGAFVSAPVRIGADVWVGAKATILKGVTIGDRAVVAANTVVTRDVPPDTLVAGVPAQTVRSWPAVEG